MADGEVTRQKGDQVAIEICQGKALIDGNLKEKIYDSKMVYVVNHESNSIYNDIKHFSVDKMEDAYKEFDKFPKNDSTILVRGTDGSILKKKGEDNFVNQNIAYLYNDNETKGKL